MVHKMISFRGCTSECEPRANFGYKAGLDDGRKTKAKNVKVSMRFTGLKELNFLDG